MEIHGSKAVMDGLDRFPAEVLTLVLELLDLDSLLKCYDVCRSWRKHCLYEPHYLPHVLDAYNQLTHGTRPLPATLREPQRTRYLKELFRTSVSALPVFAECQTLRDIAVVLHRLDKSWLSGSNTSFASFNHGEVHQMPILAVAIDAKSGSIVSGDSQGYVAFWDVSAGTCYHQCRFHINGQGRWAVPYQMAIEGDIMVIGTPSGGVVVAIRDQSGGPEPFVKVTEFWTTSSHITSLRVEGYVCIVGEAGQVTFWDLSSFVDRGNHIEQLNMQPFASNLMTIGTQNNSAGASSAHSLFYKDGCLFVGLAGSGIQRIGSRERMTLSVGKQLWEHDYEHEPAHEMRLIEGPEIHGLGDMGCTRLCPVGNNGDVLVSWADSSIYLLRSNTDNDFVWDPQPECLIPVAEGPYKKTVGIYARGERVICRFRHNGVETFLGDGTALNRISCNYGAVSCVAVDPAFIVIGTREAALCVYYFAPGRQISTHGQGPSSSAATSASRPPFLDRKHTYKRKYQEAMGMDLEPQVLVDRPAKGFDEYQAAAKDVPRDGAGKPLVYPTDSTSIQAPMP